MDITSFRDKNNPLRWAQAAHDYIQDTLWEGKPTVVFWGGQFWRWSEANPVFVPESEDTMSDVLLRWLVARGITSDSRYAELTRDVLRATIRLPIGTEMPCWLGGDSRHDRYTSMANGIVDVVTTAMTGKSVVSAHTPSWFSGTLLPYPCWARAECPLWLEWLDQQVPEKDAQALLQEFTGYVLTPDTHYQTCLFLVGPAQTGKSTVGKVMRQLMGARNVSSVSLADLTTDFKVVETVGKALNIADEVPATLPKGVEQAFKWFLGGLPVQFRNLYEKAHSRRPTARLLVNVNEWPQFADQEDAVYRRIMVVPMVRKIPRMDPMFEERLFEELPGIFWWAMEGLKRLTVNRAFTRCEKGEVLKQSHKQWAQPAITWARESTEVCPDGFVTTAEIERAFEKWCREVGIRHTNTTTRDLKTAIYRACPESRDDRVRMGTTLRRGVRGIKLV